MFLNTFCDVKYHIYIYDIYVYKYNDRFASTLYWGTQ